MPAPLHGSCLCGGVRYEIRGPLTGALNCHCTMCRKAHGAAFRSRASVQASDFRWLQGEVLLSWYESSPGNHRGFCKVCGSPLLSRFDADLGRYGLPLGALDDDPGIRPACHVFVADKAPWHTISDTLPQQAGLPEMPAAED
ncbi:MAG TPA: GFA family protein [Rhodocyclaceae bacterium]|nr:GFA family protein [Rhodocyclaceae bacterium]